MDRQIFLNLRLNRLPLLPLLAVALPLLVQILPLLLGAHAAQHRVALLLLHLVARELALLGLLFFVDALYFVDLLLARGFDAPHGFGAEVGRRDEDVGEAEEVLEEREGAGVWSPGGLELEREVYALTGDGVVKPEWMVSTGASGWGAEVDLLLGLVHGLVGDD